MKKNNTIVVEQTRLTNMTIDKTMLNNIIKKINNDILTQYEFEYFKQIALKNKTSLMSYLQKETGFRFYKINVVENNEIFQKLLCGINLLKTDNPTVKVDYIFDVLVISKKNKMEATFHNVIKISLNSGSYIKISSATLDSLEISVIRVNENNIRKGEGSRLMNIVFDFCYSQLEFRPRFILECTGGLKSQGILTTIGIKEQTCFFRKFGFRVVNNKQYKN